MITEEDGTANYVDFRNAIYARYAEIVHKLELARSKIREGRAGGMPACRDTGRFEVRCASIRWAACARRPPAARVRRSTRRATPPRSELDRAKDEAIRHVIARQEAIGYPILTDGECGGGIFRKASAGPVLWIRSPRRRQIDGRREPAALVRAEQNFTAPGPAIRTRRRVVERLRLVRNMPLEEYRYSSEVAARPVKVTVLSPDRISQRFDWKPREASTRTWTSSLPMSWRSSAR